jgi:hypothetical protein
MVYSDIHLRVILESGHVGDIGRGVVNMKKLILSLVLVIVLLIPAAGCGSKVDFEPLELVPDGVQMVAGIRVSEALRDWSIYSQLDGSNQTSEQFDEAKEEFLNRTGIDLNDISEAVVFASLSENTSPEQPEYAAVIMTGNFADKELISRIEEKTEKELVPEEYGDFTLYLDAVGESGLVLVSNTMLILGTIDALKDCLDVAGGVKEAAGGVLMDTYNNMGEVMLRLSLIIPKKARESFAEQPAGEMMPVGMKAFADMETLGMAAMMSPQGLTFKMNADFSVVDSADEAAESLETMIKFFGIMSSDSETADMLERIKISSGNSRLSLTYDITLAELAGMMESLGNGNGEGFPMMPSLFPGMDKGDNLSDYFGFPKLPEH